MPHVPSSRVNSPSARSWQRHARRVGKCSPKRAEDSATACPNRRRQFLTLNFGKCSSPSRQGLQPSSVPGKGLSVALLGQAWCACACLLRTGNSRLRVKRKRGELGNLAFQDFGFQGAKPEKLSSGRIFVIKLKRIGNTEVPRKLEKGFRHKNASSYAGRQSSTQKAAQGMQ